MEAIEAGLGRTERQELSVGGLAGETGYWIHQSKWQIPRMRHRKDTELLLQWRGAVRGIPGGVGRKVGSGHKLPMKGTNSRSRKRPRTACRSQLRGSPLGAVWQGSHFWWSQVRRMVLLEPVGRNKHPTMHKILFLKSPAPKNYLVQNVWEPWYTASLWVRAQPLLSYGWQAHFRG